MSRRAAVVSLSLLILAIGVCARAEGPRGEPPLNPIMGEFAGTFTPAGGQAVKAEAKVIADEQASTALSSSIRPATPRPNASSCPASAKTARVAIEDQGLVGHVTKDGPATSLPARCGNGRDEARRAKEPHARRRSRPPARWSSCPSRKASRPTSTSGPRINWVCEPDGCILVRRGRHQDEEGIRQLQAARRVSRAVHARCPRPGPRQ